MTSTTEITVVTGDATASTETPSTSNRSSSTRRAVPIMEFAWLVDAETGEDLAVSPERVVILRAVGS
jgi:hypothetical protein